MNKFTIIFLLLFFVGVIIVGVVAVRQELFKRSEAGGGTVCAIPKLNLTDSCPSGQRHGLGRAANGCFVFKCQ